MQEAATESSIEQAASDTDALLPDDPQQALNAARERNEKLQEIVERQGLKIERLAREKAELMRANERLIANATNRRRALRELNEAHVRLLAQRRKDVLEDLLLRMVEDGKLPLPEHIDHLVHRMRQALADVQRAARRSIEGFEGTELDQELTELQS